MNRADSDDIHFLSNFAGCPPTQTPTQMFKIGFFIFGSQGISSGLVQLKVIFEALQSEIFRSKFHSLESKMQKNPGIQPSDTGIKNPLGIPVA